MQSIDKKAQACRRLWSAALLAILDDYNLDYSRAQDPETVLEHARRYLTSRNGRTVAALAGIDMNLDAALRLIALPRRSFKLRTLNTKESHHGEDRT